MSKTNIGANKVIFSENLERNQTYVESLHRCYKQPNSAIIPPYVENRHRLSYDFKPMDMLTTRHTRPRLSAEASRLGVASGRSPGGEGGCGYPFIILLPSPYPLPFRRRARLWRTSQGRGDYIWALLKLPLLTACRAEVRTRERRGMGEGWGEGVVKTLKPGLRVTQVFCLLRGVPAPEDGVAVWKAPEFFNDLFVSDGVFQITLVAKGLKLGNA